jgi:hypothetical protein
VKTLDRIVSLQDYEDFARAYAGIAKALATWTWDGHRRGVFLTIAAAGGAPVPDKVRRALLTDIADYSEDFVLVRAESFVERLFRVKGTLRVDPDRTPDVVRDEAVKVLRKRFAFDAREFGQPVALSEVVATLHRVDGVLSVDVDALWVGETATTPPPERLVAALPAPRDRTPLPAELLTLHPAMPDLKAP